MTERGKKLINGVIRTGVKLLIAAAVIVWFFRSQTGSILHEVDKFDFVYLLPALILTFAATLVTGIRWRDLAQTSGIKLSRSKAFWSGRGRGYGEGSFCGGRGFSRVGGKASL